MEKRILTLVVEIDQNERPDWIWQSHILKEKIHGIHVISITEGNECQELENTIEELEEHIRGM